MKQMFSFAAKAALAMLLMCVIMLFIVTPGSAEWVIMVISTVMMVVLLTVSALLLRKENKKIQRQTWQRYKFNLRNSLFLEEIFNHLSSLIFFKIGTCV